jgi:hypothetical protein
LKAVESLQDESGGFHHRRSSVDPRATALAVSMLIALRSEGIEVETEAAIAYLQQTDPVAWVEAEGVTLTEGEVVKIVMALVGAGGDARNVGGNDLVARLVDSWNGEAGVYGSILFDSPLVVMALAVADEPFEEKAIETFAATQLDDGSWNPYGETGSGDTWVTAVIVQALVAAGQGDDPMIDDAVAFFHAVQREDGAIASSPGSVPDSYSSALVVSALIAAGEDPKAEEWGDDVSGLLALQNKDGSFRRYPELPEFDFDCTTAALVALTGAYWPVLSAE